MSADKWVPAAERGALEQIDRETRHVSGVAGHLGQIARDALAAAPEAERVIPERELREFITRERRVARFDKGPVLDDLSAWLDSRVRPEHSADKRRKQAT